MKNVKSVKFGIILILLSGVAFAIMLLIPFLDLESKTKAFASGTAFVVMEILFYTGGFFVGKELFKKYKSYFDPRNWFRNKSLKNNQ